MLKMQLPLRFSLEMNISYKLIAYEGSQINVA